MWYQRSSVVRPLAAIFAVYSLYWLTQRLRLYLKRRKFAREHNCEPLPSANRWDPFFAIDYILEAEKPSKEGRYLEHWHKNFFVASGRHTRGIQIAGKSLIFTNEPEICKAVLATQFNDFVLGERRNRNIGALLGQGVFSSDGEVWQHGRAVLRPNLDRKSISDLDLFERHFQVWLREMKTDRGPVELQSWLYRFTLDIATEFLMDRSTGVLYEKGEALGQKFAWAFGKAGAGMLDLVRAGVFAPLYPYLVPDFPKACKILHDYVDDIVRDSLAQAKEKESIEPEVQVEKGDELDDEVRRHTFLQALINEGLTPRQIRDQILTALLAARDTTASMLSSCFFTLARRPDIMAKLRSEIQTHLPDGRHPSYADLKSMHYVNWVIKETLRVFPSVPINIRVAKHDTTLPVGGGPDGTKPIFVRKDQEVGMWIHSMHRRRDLWGEDADEFRPERWETARPLFEWLPFNGGPRMCLGQQFALLESGYTIVRLLQEFSTIEAPANVRDETWTEKLTLTCCVGQGVWVDMKRV